MIAVGVESVAPGYFAVIVGEPAPVARKMPGWTWMSFVSSELTQVAALVMSHPW